MLLLLLDLPDLTALCNGKMWPFGDFWHRATRYFQVYFHRDIPAQWARLIPLSWTPTYTVSLGVSAVHNAEEFCGFLASVGQPEFDSSPS